MRGISCLAIETDENVLQVKKFGGAAVATTDQIHACAGIIAAAVEAGHQVITVVSAMGAQTDQLVGLAREIHPDPPPREMDMLLTAGERVSMALMSMALQHRGIRALSLTGSQSGILTDGTHGNARIRNILGDRIRRGLAENMVVIVAGFQGVDPETKEITTLGRGGSDLTAIALAVRLGAGVCQLYKDVPGICSADPGQVANARLLRHIPPGAMLEACWKGAGVIHARAVQVAALNRLPLEICSTADQGKPGTRIEEKEISMESLHVYTLTEKKDLCRMHVSACGSRNPGGDALLWLWQRGETPVLIRQEKDGDQPGLSLIVPSALSVEFRSWAKDKAGLQAGQVSETDGLASLAIIGSGFWQHPEAVSRILALAGNFVHTFDQTNTVLTLVGPAEDSGGMMDLLHDHLFGVGSEFKEQAGMDPGIV